MASLDDLHVDPTHLGGDPDTVEQQDHCPLTGKRVDPSACRQCLFYDPDSGRCLVEGLPWQALRTIQRSTRGTRLTRLGGRGRSSRAFSRQFGGFLLRFGRRGRGGGRLTPRFLVGPHDNSPLRREEPEFKLPDESREHALRWESPQAMPQFEAPPKETRSERAEWEGELDIPVGEPSVVVDETEVTLPETFVEMGLEVQSEAGSKPELPVHDPSYEVTADVEQPARLDLSGEPGGYGADAADPTEHLTVGVSQEVATGFPPVVLAPGEPEYGPTTTLPDVDVLGNQPLPDLPGEQLF